MALNLITALLVRRERLECREKHGGKIHADKGRDQTDAAASQGLQTSARSWEEAREASSLEPAERSNTLV